MINIAPDVSWMFIITLLVKHEQLDTVLTWIKGKSWKKRCSGLFISPLIEESEARFEKCGGFFIRNFHRVLWGSSHSSSDARSQ